MTARPARCWAARTDTSFKVLESRLSERNAVSEFCRRSRNKRLREESTSNMCIGLQIPVSGRTAHRLAALFGNHNSIEGVRNKKRTTSGSSEFWLRSNINKI